MKQEALKKHSGSCMNWLDDEDKNLVKKTFVWYNSFINDLKGKIL